MLKNPNKSNLIKEATNIMKTSSNVFVRMGNYPWRRINHKLATSMKIWKGKGSTTTLLFSLKELEILHQERRDQVNTTVMEHFNSKSRPADKQVTYQSITPINKSQLNFKDFSTLIIYNFHQRFSLLLRYLQQELFKNLSQLTILKVIKQLKCRRKRHIQIESLLRQLQ